MSVKHKCSRIMIRGPILWRRMLPVEVRLKELKLDSISTMTLIDAENYSEPK